MQIQLKQLKMMRIFKFDLTFCCFVVCFRADKSCFKAHKGKKEEGLLGSPF